MSDAEFQMPTEKRVSVFMDRVCPEPNTGCWLWVGSYSGPGYSHFFDKRSGNYGHRFSWRLANKSEIPAGMVVRHKCDVPCCVNPNHLLIGTQAENFADQAARGRRPRGEARAHAKLNAPAIHEIRRRAALGEHQEHIAMDFGIASQTVSNIHCRKTWRHIQP